MRFAGKRTVILTLALLALSVALPAQAASDDGAQEAITPVLRAIPDNALGFVLMKNLGQADGAVSKLAGILQVPAPSMLAMLKLQLGVQAGLDENGSAAIAVLPGEDSTADKPVLLPVVLLPVSDYKKFVSQLQPDDASAEIAEVMLAGRPMLVGHKDSYAVFTTRDNKDALTKLLGTNAGIDSKVKSFEPWLARHQVSLLTTTSGSKLALEVGVKQLKKISGMFEMMPDKGQATQVVAAMKMYEDILTKLSQQVDTFALGLQLDGSSNLSLDSRTTFLAGGSWAAAFQKLRPVEAAHFGGLRAKPFIFAMDGIYPEGSGKAVASFTSSYFTQFAGGMALSPEQQKKYTEAFESTGYGDRSAVAIYTNPKPGESLYDGLIGIMTVDDANTSLSRIEKAFNELSQLDKNNSKAPMRFTNAEKIEVDGVKGMAITMDISGMLGTQNNPAMAKMMSKMLGTEGKLTARYLLADEHTLIFAYGSDENIKQAYEEFKNPNPSFASAPNVAGTLKLLPAEAQWIFLMDLKGYVELIRSVTKSMGVPVPLPKLPETAAIGFSAKGSSDGLDTKLVVPSETLVSLSKAFGSQHKRSHE